MPSIGIDLGGTKCLGVLLGDDGRVLAEARVPTPAGPDAIVDAIVAVAVELGTAPVVGVGVAGLVDREGTVRFSPNLPGIVDLRLGARLSDRLDGVHVAVDNDATCAGWGERQRGAARGASDAILVTLGTGIGGGIIVDGLIERGANGFAGEIGHMVVDIHGPPCTCGKRGCWETLASGRGLGRLAREAAQAGRAARVSELAGGDPEGVRGEHLTQACREGDRQAGAVMAEFAWWVALGLANLAYVFDPEVFVIGGGLIEAGDVLLPPLEAAFVELVAGISHRPPVRIVPAELGERAGAIGAALIASAP